MRYLIVRVLLSVCIVSLVGLALLDPAWATACVPRGSCPQPAPGPLIGFGLPLAGAALAALLVVRHYRQKD